MPDCGFRSDNGIKIIDENWTDEDTQILAAILRRCKERYGKTVEDVLWILGEERLLMYLTNKKRPKKKANKED